MVAPLKAGGNGSSLAIISSGRDKKFGTNDDLRFERTRASSNQANTAGDPDRGSAGEIRRVGRSCGQTIANERT